MVEMAGVRHGQGRNGFVRLKFVSGKRPQMKFPHGRRALAMRSRWRLTSSMRGN